MLSLVRYRTFSRFRIFGKLWKHRETKDHFYYLFFLVNWLGSLASLGIHEYIPLCISTISEACLTCSFFMITHIVKRSLHLHTAPLIISGQWLLLVLHKPQADIFAKRSRNNGVQSDAASCWNLLFKQFLKSPQSKCLKMPYTRLHPHNECVRIYSLCGRHDFIDKLQVWYTFVRVGD